MWLRVLRLVMLVVTALGLSPGVAHVMELPVKMGYGADRYMAVTSTLYQMYGIVGAAFQVGAVVCAGVLCWAVRGRPGFWWTVAGLVGLVVSLGLWAGIVQPVNVEWGRVLRADPSGAAADYLRLRGRWEYGHVAACGVWLVGFGCLAYSCLVEVPEVSGRRREEL